MQTKDNAQFHIVLAKGWIQKGKKFLLAKRSSKELQSPDLWSLPGGKVENEVGEDTVYETLRKEIKEEAGVDISGPFEMTRNYSFRRVDGAHIVGLTFLCRWQKGKAKPLEDTQEVAWLSLKELREFHDAPNFLRNEIEKLTEFLKTRKK